MDSPHIPVLLEEVLDSFKDIEKGYFVDCTVGYGGHSSKILDLYKDKIELICIDRDDEALNFSKKRLNKAIFYKGSFSQVLPTLKEKPIVAILADFGVSSLQLDKKERGFSFDSTNLDMRMDKNQSLTALDVINRYSKLDLEYIFKEYGEIRPYKKLVSEILAKRPINFAYELVDIAKKVMPKSKHNPATLVFQAIRIEVNDELGEIERLLDFLEEKKFKNSIISLITFHSLEDRIVKNRFKKWATNCICSKEVFRCECGNNNALGKIITKKPIVATNKEIKQNPRSRSAKLRVFRFF